MRFVRPATHDDMVAAFLRAEIDSPRFGVHLRRAMTTLGAPVAVIREPDTNDEGQNRLRSEVFSSYRGIPPFSGLFAGFPDDVAWAWAILTPAELGEVLYINWDYWLEVSGGTRRPRDALARLSDNEDVTTLARQIEQGSMPPEIVLVGATDGSRLVVLEGHIRLTAMVKGSAVLPSEVRVLIGHSARMQEWPLY